MSVAFRREGDDEHLEPKFEIPIPPGPNLVTARGKALIDARVIEMEARVAADLDETALKAAKRDLRYWQTRQVTAEVQPVPDGSVVAFGTRVTFLLNGKERVLGLVGDDEADPAAGLVSFSAPLARALMGAEEGELLPFNGREDAIEVLAVDAL
ncbi:GreA/GreB family elongation factor [Novosphingobium mangrovi (ex Huang et al. 2023)]|uniref:GreA/GreB family elongation factor n=1 Tax=Novosphingobium mangrovi (ex Huang et al. 2023) TaxID=2976432 RepID=A0ABT2I3H1_9SPHN|nr:GreA/GreB family elongation factor [Novosphingobium mangrovi (ex Huang et al. 2023)]MCT2399356.1 GreA/GreB family elongation factor [Novosphingobium mangrovi (ex Huang et al. 2023)]